MQEEERNHETLIDLSSGPSNPDRHKEVGRTSQSPESLATVDNVSLSSDESCTARQQVPAVNCPEKIILCVDLSPEMNETSFHCRSAPERTAYQFVRKASQMFVKNKAYLNPSHEYGIIVLEDEASWYQQFESNPDTVCTVLDHLTPNQQDTKDTFDLETLFQSIQTGFVCPQFWTAVYQTKFLESAESRQELQTQSRIVLPELEDVHLPPPYVVRVILMYGRSLCPPIISPRAHQILHSLMQSPYFFFDVLYVHQLPTENNKCESIYDAFCELDEDEAGYMLEVSRSTTRLFDHMAALLAHPLQRPKQRDTYYLLKARDDQETQ